MGIHKNEHDTVYLIDENDLLISFNEHWDEFAKTNGNPDLASDKVNKKPIWDFIHDAETRHIHKILLKKVRTNHAVLNLPFRCDAPALRRHMEMNISLLPDDTIEYRCRAIKTEIRDPAPANIIYVNNDESFLRACSWCNKIDLGNNSWVEIEEAVKSQQLFMNEILPISHTMCDACMDYLDKTE